MKLLFDANLSPKLSSRLSDLFPGSTHVFETGLARHTTDRRIWEYARANQFVIVTADSDFLALAAVHGSPPYVIHIERCGYRTALVETLLRRSAAAIVDLERSSNSILTIRDES